MNIFYLDKNPEICAQYHCDPHVVKMSVEYAQILSAAHRLIDNNNNPILYKLTHKNHPSVIWARKSKENYEWLYSLFVELCKEYTYRYEKTHLTEKKLKDVLKYAPKNIESLGFTEMPQCMPDHCKITNNSIEAYKNYYKIEKLNMLKYTKREKPNWI